MTETLLEDLDNIAKDPEFQYDFNLPDTITGMDIVIDSKLLKVSLVSLKEDIESDMQMELADNEDVNYLQVRLDEINELLLNIV